MPAATSQSPLDDLRPLTVPEVAELIRKSERDVQRKVADGVFQTLEPPRKGRRPLITVSSVRAFLEGGAA